MHRQNVQRQNVPWDKMSHGHKAPRHKLPRTKRPRGKNLLRTKRPKEQNVKWFITLYPGNIGLDNRPHTVCMLGNALNFEIGLFLSWGG